MVTGGPEVGAALVDDPDVACIAFTGSTAVGTRIAVRAAEQLKRVNLELGGIDPLIVFEDADLDVAVPGAAWARFLNNGQVCTSAKRIYVVEPIAKAFVERFVAHTRSLRVGNGMDPETDLGPLISERARDAGGSAGRSARSPRARGCWRADARLDVGPGLVLRADRADRRAADARRRVRRSVRADRVDSGRARTPMKRSPLAARRNTVWARTSTRSNLTWALTAMQEIKAGTFWINDPLTDNDAAPFGGMRKSGMGRELGEEGLDAFRETKHVHLDFVPERKAFWFPYRQRRAEIPE